MFGDFWFKGGALVIIFDVGNSVSTPNSDESKTFFEKAKDCISWILRRKILSMNKDLVCILVTGTDEEGESLDDLDVTLCRNISIKYDFQVTSWEMLQYIDKEVKPRDQISDWVGTLSVAVEKLKILQESHSVSSKTIAVFSDLNYTFTEAVSTLMEGIMSCNIEVNVIGTDYFFQVSENENFECEEPPAKKLCLEEVSNLEKSGSINGEKLLCIMCHWARDLIRACNFNSAMRYLSCYVKKKPRPIPWNCVMDIGAFKISVQLFKKVDRKPHFRPNLKFLRSEGNGSMDIVSQPKLSEVKRDKAMYYIHCDGSSSKPKERYVEEDEFIEGYRYGTSIIPFSDEDKVVLGYKPGKKCFTVLGFTHADNIPYCGLVGDGCYIVVPRDKDEFAEMSLSAIVQAMSETRNVAIVRRVYSDDRGLSLGVLYPVVEELSEYNCKECLIYIELAFHEETKVIELPRLRRIKNKINEEQYNVIDNLIDEMNLIQSNREDQTNEELDLSMRHEFKDQFYSHCIAQKALYPNEPLPRNLAKYCLQSSMLPDFISLRSETFNEKLRELFPINENQIGKLYSVSYAKNGEKSEKMLSFSTTILENEKSPENFFKKLFEMYEYPPVTEIQPFLELSVTSLNFREEEIVESFLKWTREVRQKAIQNFTDNYNFWMRKLRIHLGTEKQLERLYWDGVLAGNLGLITEEEHKDSIIKKEEADFFINSLRKYKELEEKQLNISNEVGEAINALF